ncbi:MAG: DUF5103 domain-containing protein [Candidatus Kapabacteria bacterium]|nr:DUF5103 domain-containing protein [Candidatus Kapabacteria bacterium]
MTARRSIVAMIALLVQCMSVMADDLPLVRGIRAYGGRDERLPPVLLMESQQSSGRTSPVGSSSVTIEFDIAHSTIPNLYARIFHCAPDWTEDANGFINDVTNRTMLIDWSVAPQRSRWFNYRGRIELPNPQLRIRFSGNWVFRLYDLDTDKQLAEQRFFVVEPMADATMNMMTEFYEPRFRVSGTGLLLETWVSSRTRALVEGLQQTVATYRTHRWYEPFIITQSSSLQVQNPPQAGTNVMGMLAANKVYRVGPVPAENEYRILEADNTGFFPPTGQPIRLPLSDLPRNGSFLQRATDGALITSMVSSSDDEYVAIEFMLDPVPFGEIDRDVFLVGSFNSWKPDRTWQMSFDDDLRLYRLRQWVRRGRHNYLYGSGTLDADNGTVRDLSFEEFEGNTAAAGHGFISFVYYRVQDFGGYDGIIAVATSNMYQSR